MLDHPAFSSSTRRFPGGAFAATLTLFTALGLGLVLQSCLLGNSGRDPAAPAEGKGYFRFTAPVAGQGFDMDSNFSVLWTPADAVLPDSQYLDLYTGSRFLARLSVIAPGAEGYDWLPAASIPATGYLLGTGVSLRLKITSRKDTAKWDFSPAFVLISKYSGKISIASPTATSDVRLNSAFTIRWSASGNIGPAVGIQVFKDTVWIATLAPALSATGSAIWSPVQSVLGPGSGYRIRVFSRNNPGLTALSPAFSISSLSAGTLVLLAPAAGDTVDPKSNRVAKIKWARTGDPGTSASLSLLRDSVFVANLGNVVLANDSLIWSPSAGLPTSSHYRIQMASQSDSSIVAYSKEFTIKGLDRDAYEPDDSLRAADSIGTDGSGQLRTLTDGDEDWARFTAATGKKYLLSLRVTTSSASFPDSFQAYFVDSAGYARNFQSGSNLRMILAPAYSGAYFIKVRCPRGYGGYTLSVSAYDTAAAPYFIPFLAPNAKTAWPAGSLNSIAYTPDSTYFGTQVSLALYDDTTFVQTLAAQTPNSGLFSWNLPAGLSTSNRYRVRIANYYLPSIFAYSEKFTINGIPPDAYEPDNGPATAKDIPATGAIQSRSLTLNDTDWVGFNALAGKAYLFSVNGSVTTYTFITDSAGTVSNYNSGTKYFLTFTPKQAGRYYAHVQYYGGNGTALTYALSLNATDSAQGSAPLQFRSPADTTAWNSGGAYTLNWTPDTVLFSAYVDLALYADSLLVQTIANTVLNSGVYSVSLPSGLITSNRYRIRMVNRANAQIYAFSGYFTINGLKRDDYEPDNARTKANNIATDGTLQAHTLTPNDSDWVQFNATVGKSYLITANGNASIYAFLEDSAGVQYSSGTGTKFSQVFTPLRAGKYYLRTQYYGGYSAYTLAVIEFPTGKAPATAKFQAPTDTSAWAAGASYTVGWTPDTAWFGNYVNLSLYQDSTLMQTLTSSVANNGTYIVSLLSGLATSNRYRIRMASSGNSDIYAYGPYFTVRGLASDTLEPDNRQTLAQPITTDGVPQARAMTINDTDWIQFNATAGKSYLVSINGNGSGGIGVYAYLLDSGGTQLGYNYGVKFSQSFTPARSGKYYARMQYYNGYGAYAVSVTEFDANAGSVAAKVQAPSDTSVWVLGTTSPLVWTPDTARFGSSVSLSLYLDSNLIQSLASNISNTGSYSVFAPNGLVASSRYRIRIASAANPQLYGYSGYFTINGVIPDPYETDNGKIRAKDIPTDGSAQAHTLSLNDTDWVAFSGVAGKSYLINFSGGMTISAYLTDSGGSQLNHDYASRLYFYLSPSVTGKYYLWVIPYSGYGAYTITVKEFDPAVGSAQPVFQAPDSATTWASGSTYTAALTPDTATFGTYVSLSLYFDTTLVQSLGSSISNSGSASVSLPNGLASSNHYRIRVSGGNTTQLYGYGPYFSIAGISADSLEPNDSANAASSVTLNATPLPLTLSNQDRDWFRFTGTAQQLYVIQAASAGALETTLRLYSGLGASSLQTNYKTSSYDTVNTINWICPANGQYSVSVEPYSRSYYGAYGFQIKEVDPTQYRFGVTSPTAALTAHVGAALPITWTDPSALKGLVDIFLYNATGVVQTIYSAATNNGAYTWTVPATLPSGSAYYIKVISRISGSISGTSPLFSIAP